MIDINTANNTNLQQAVTGGLFKFLGEDLDHSKIRLLFTGAAPYYPKDGQGLHNMFPNLIHVPCLCHGLNRVAEQKEFPLVNQLVSEVENVFLRSPRRKKDLAATGLAPPCREPGWRLPFTTAPTSTAIDIIKAKELLNMEELPAQLATIKANFSGLVAAIIALEERLPLRESQGIIEKPFASKLNQVLQKNPGFGIMENIVGILNGSSTELHGLAPNDPYLIRAFSKLKKTLADQRTSLMDDHVRDILIRQWNHSL
ncbi:Uncharacterized protein FKW44_002528 [Caligus rogercresseyi]|uniref:DUF659 domain-containing protein n=1 Tax=Caligus rogercresseyi TaxID=217165 RepID=A0A7T8QWE2_CALRO|nr:Uncharacterized protein FKW44_002528 [Caligus rogercresseyi]